MIKRIGNIITFIVLSGLLLLNGTSRQFIHEFANHQDTVDHPIHDPNGTKAFFESQHHHCAFLSMLIPVYHPTEEHFELTFVEEAKPEFQFSSFIPFIEDRAVVALRGPPYLR